jgi:phosphopantothenoylcysteine synthetase/decarboxylase
MDVVIAAAVVAIISPKLWLLKKNKKTDDTVIELEKTKDILASLGR